MTNCATYGSCNMCIFVVHEFSQPKISNNCFKFLIQQYICSFHIPVNNFWITVIMQISQPSSSS
uniref:BRASSINOSTEROID INSENSITIVE 1-associated receptor kinase 1 n=1 Tax=Rhizophora mucronata TaxID=61149 RepID=A0A2P2MS29_RHIMU